MTKLNSIIRLLNKELDIKTIPDSSKNGMQFRAKKEVKKVGFAVDAADITFKKAKKLGCDLLIVHHGLLWKNRDKTNVKQKRLKTLKKLNLSLYAAHLPLDMDKKYGNNIKLAKLLDLEKIRKFGKYENISIGYSGLLKKPMKGKELIKLLNKNLKTKSNFAGNPNKKIKSIGIVSGSFKYGYYEAIKKGIDCYLTGTMDLHSASFEADENNILIITSGHYATETLGVKALMPLIKEKFNIDTVFIDNPTGF